MRHSPIFRFRKIQKKCLAAVLCIALLAGCGNGSDSGSAGTGKTEGNDAGASPACAIVYDQRKVWKTVELSELGTLAVPETGEGSKVRLRKFLTENSGEEDFSRLFDQVVFKGESADGEPDGASEGTSNGASSESSGGRTNGSSNRASGGESGVISYGIARYDLQGNLLESHELPEWRTDDGGVERVIDAAEKDGTCYLLTDEKLAVIAPDGKRTEFEPEGYLWELISAGKALFLAEIGGGQTVLRRIDANGMQENEEDKAERVDKSGDTGKVDNKTSNTVDNKADRKAKRQTGDQAGGGTRSIVIPVEGEKFYTTGDLEKDGSVYLSRGNQLFRYDTAKDETSLVLEWDSSGVLSTSLLAILSADAETIRVLYYENENIIMKSLKPTTDSDGRTVLTLMTHNNNYKVMRDIVYAFNQSNERYKVELIDPFSQKSAAEVSSAEWEEARTRAQLLLTTPDAPDLVDVDFFGNWESFAEQEVFEDLTPYLEASSVLDAEAYVPSVLACGQAAGKQIFLPNEFYFRMLYGQEQYLGREVGWTLREFLDMRKEHKDIPIFATQTSAEGTLNSLLGMSMEEFVDAEQNICDFCNPLFYDLLACAAYEETFVENMQWESSNLDKLISGEALLDEAVIMNEIFYLADTNVILTGDSKEDSNKDTSGDFDGDSKGHTNWNENFNAEIRMTVKGYPAKDGTGSGEAGGSNGGVIYLSSFCNLAISNMGTHKEGAWEFIEFIQEYEPDYGFTAFSARKDRLKRDLHTLRFTQKEMNGVPLRKYTAEDETTLWEIIEGLRRKTGRDEQLLKIIGEEAQVYFNGQKSVEETAKVIQNRVQLYLWENF